MKLRLRAAADTDLAAIGQLGAPAAPPEDGDEWLLVAEAADGAIAASVRVRRAIGLKLPRYWWHVGCVVHAAAELGLFHRQRTLLLGSDHTGASELAGLVCDRRRLGLADQASALRFVVQAALLLIARERERFAPLVIVELPGLRDASGQSPFWRGFGAHFYNGDPLQAHASTGEAWRSHVAALLPRHPVGVDFLPGEAQAALAQVAPKARNRLEVLALEGFRYGHHVGIDDGGPVFEGHLDALQGVLDSGRRVLAPASGQEPSRAWLVAGEHGTEVVSMQATGSAGGRLRIDPAAFALLAAAAGQTVWARRAGDAAR